jgi:spore coat polysaccharide biosynthesis protein SpsF
VTAYELAAYGVPSLYLCLEEDHALSATAFEAAGMGHSLGLAAATSEDAIAQAVANLLGDPARRKEMRAAGLSTVDGEGAARVAADLARHLVERRTLTSVRSMR